MLSTAPHGAPLDGARGHLAAAAGQYAMTATAVYYGTSGRAGLADRWGVLEAAARALVAAEQAAGAPPAAVGTGPAPFDCRGGATMSRTIAHQPATPVADLLPNDQLAAWTALAETLPPPVVTQVRRLLLAAYDEGCLDAVETEMATWQRVLAHVPGLAPALELLQEHVEEAPTCTCLDQ